MDNLQTAAIFLISTVFDLYLFILGLRMILVWVRADYHNPLSRFVVQLTQTIIQPLRRIIPNVTHIELSTLLVMLALELLKFFLIFWITTGLPAMLGVLILSFADSLKIFLNIFFYAILIQAILSWIHAAYSPILTVLMQITYPVVRPFQRLIPPVSGLDISPIPAMIVLQLLIIVMVNPLFSLGTRMVVG